MNQAPSPDSDPLIPIDDLDRAITSLCARINAENYELLTLIREFDERLGWLLWGFSSCAEWLHWRCDLSLQASREKVRMAHGLKDLPAISEAFAKGTLSYSKVRALTRVADALNEKELLAFAMTTTAARVEERCRQMRNTQSVSTHDANRAHTQRTLRQWHDRSRDMMVITVELPAEQGALVMKAVDKALEQGEPAEGVEFEESTWAAQQADALVEMSKSYLSGGADAKSSSADHYQVMVHVDETALAKGEGRSDLPLESVKRLSCDGSIVSIVEDESGEPLKVGRKQRTVPSALKRALWSRDKGCAFPGCTHTHFVDAHHVEHWAEGGETSLENLMLLCTSHHRLVHEGGYAIRKDHCGRWYFRRPDGRAIPAHGYQPQEIAAVEVILDGASAEAWVRKSLNNVRAAGAARVSRS
jgi:hypothetical protein